MLEDIRIAIIGLGYVGMPLAAAFAKKRNVIAFDVNKQRISQLLDGIDATHELERSELLELKNDIVYTHDESDLAKANFYIITVPTPIDEAKTPDLSFLRAASEIVGKSLEANDIVVYESTVYPGVTEDYCAPILSKYSGLDPILSDDSQVEKGFHLGYSPERINPGDKVHRVETIVKVVSGSNSYATKVVDGVYSLIVDAGTYVANSIKVAEAAKVIENTQRDVNIALMNELSILFKKLDINTRDVIDAASTKWNFLPFSPGLVGGHCIGVDPYYLTHKARTVDHNPEMILAGRRINDSMSSYVAQQFVFDLCKKGIFSSTCRVLVMGYTFKENCPDTRNTKVSDLVESISKSGVLVHVYDPVAESLPEDVENLTYFGSWPENYESYDAIIIAVNHSGFKAHVLDNYSELLNEKHVVYDLKGSLKGTGLSIDYCM